MGERERALEMSYVACVLDMWIIFRRYLPIKPIEGFASDTDRDDGEKYIILRS